MNAARSHRSLTIRTTGVIFFLLACIASAIPLSAQTANDDIYIITLDGNLDRGLAPYAERVIADAERAGASAIVVQIDTRGGELDAGLRIQRAMLDSQVTTISFVDGEALAEGALIAIAAEVIFMTPGSVLGAADNPRHSATSSVAKRFRSTAEERGRDPDIAAAMADPRIAIDGLTPVSSALTFTAEEAEINGYADGVEPDLASVLTALGYPAGTRLVETSPTIAEDAVRLLTNPLIAAFLFAGGLILIIGGMLSSGISLLSAGGIILMTIFFWGHLLAGLAGWEGVALVAAGLVLLAIEAFVIPGVGVAGISGGICLVAGLFLSLTGGEVVTNSDRLNAAGIVALVVILGVAGSFLMLWLVPQTGRFEDMVLDTTVERDDPPALAQPVSAKITATEVDASDSRPRKSGRPVRDSFNRRNRR